MTRSRAPRPPVEDAALSPAPGRMEEAAKAAYTRPEGTIEWERRRPVRQAYWRDVARRAVTAAIPLHVLAAVAVRHTPVSRADSDAVDCTGCSYVSDDAVDHGTHLAVAIQAEVHGWDEAQILARAADQRELRNTLAPLECPRCGEIGRAVLAGDAPDDVPPAESDQWAEDEDDRGLLMCDMCDHRWRTP